MAGIEIKVTDTTRLGEFPPELGNSVSEALLRVTNKIANWIQDQTPEGATSLLRNSTRAEFPVVRGTEYVGVVGNPLKYASFILGKGAGPAVGHAQYWPPIAPLIYWAHRKGLGQGEETIRIAYAIQYIIHARGIHGKDLFDKAEAKFFSDIQREIILSLDEVEKRFSD